MKTDKTTVSSVGGAISPTAASKALWMAENLRPGEVYAGLILGTAGEPDHHLVLLPGEAEEVNWKEATDFVAKLGGQLPTRREQALLYANLKHEFKPRWYWSCEQHAALGDYAWYQSFNHGYQVNYGDKSAKLRARAVRRLPI
jgi:hypothetical protein